MYVIYVFVWSILLLDRFYLTLKRSSCGDQCWFNQGCHRSFFFCPSQTSVIDLDLVYFKVEVQEGVSWQDVSTHKVICPTWPHFGQVHFLLQSQWSVDSSDCIVYLDLTQQTVESRYHSEGSGNGMQVFFAPMSLWFSFQLIGLVVVLLLVVYIHIMEFAGTDGAFLTMQTLIFTEDVWLWWKYWRQWCACLVMCNTVSHGELACSLQVIFPWRVWDCFCDV